MIKKKFTILFFILLFLLQSCVSEFACSIQENNQTTLSFTGTMPLIFYSFATQHVSAGLPLNLSKASVMEKLEKVNGILTVYKNEQKKDTGNLEIAVQFASAESAKQFLASYGITMNYALQAKSFEWNYAPLKAYFSEDLSGFISLLFKPFSHTIRVTLPFRTLRAQNGTIAGTTATFKNTFLSLDDFFSKATYTITW